MTWQRRLPESDLQIDDRITQSSAGQTSAIKIPPPVNSPVTYPGLVSHSTTRPLVSLETEMEFYLPRDKIIPLRIKANVARKQKQYTSTAWPPTDIPPILPIRGGKANAVLPHAF